MSFTAEKKSSIILYLLEKIQQGDSSAVKKTAEVFSITPATIYKYIDELIAKNALKKIKRGKYELIRNYKTFSLKRSSGELISEQTIYEKYVRPEIQALPKNITEIWEYIIGEMVNNIIDHSAAENVLIAITSDYLNTNILLCDDGIGIFEKIKNYFNYDSIDEAVSELFKGKLTTDSVNHSGEGIFFSSRIADRFAIVSSDKIFAHDKFDPDNLQNLFTTDLPQNGTCVMISLSNWTKKKAVDVFDEFADTTYGFTKTQIPISNYFDGSPVSRSQAKRLCNRLNSFKEVELDFSGIEWMGQGFAHQLFVVFQNAYADIKLIPTNMNEAVEKMYRHVMT